MSYRYEQTEDGVDLIVDGWERGIAEGPYQIYTPSALGPVSQTGTVDLSYGNITGIPGEFSVQFPLTTTTVSGGTMYKPLDWAVEIDNGNGGTISKYFVLDSNGQIFSTSDGSTWTYKGTVGTGGIYVEGQSGLCFWQGYLFILWQTKIYYTADGTSPTDWTGTVGSLTSGVRHFAISSKISDTMYFCNSAGVGSLVLVPGQTFDPTSAATYTFQLQAVKIPSYDMATCLAEISTTGQVLIGGALNRVYPWDANNLGGSGVTSLVGLPLFLGDRFVQRIVVVNSNAYVFTGHPTIPTGRGYIYVTNGSQIDIFKKLPDNFVAIGGTNSQVQVPYWRFGDAMWHRNQIFFGAVAYPNNSSSEVTDTGGVWAIDLNSGALYRANEPSGGNIVCPSVIFPNDIGTTIAGMGYCTGGTSTNGSAVQGFMNQSTTTLSTSARMISDKIPVGTKLHPKTYNQLEIKCAVALVSGESIDISVITDADPSGHSIGSMTSTDGLSKVFTPLNLFTSTNVQGLQWLQIQATLNPTNTNPTYVRLREIRLR